MGRRGFWDFLELVYFDSSFAGRVQLACRGKRAAGIVPVFTCEISEFAARLKGFEFSPTADYFLTANCFSGVERRKEDLFSLHNLVLDVDCHLKDGRVDVSGLLWRLQHDVFLTTLPIPTCIVETGRGLQLWWSIGAVSVKLKSFYDEVLDYFLLLLSDFLSGFTLEEFSCFQTDYVASKNAVGYFRLPCTTNTKAKAKVAVDCIGERYDLMDLFYFVKREKGLLPQEEEGKFVLMAGESCHLLSDLTSFLEQRVQALYQLRGLRSAKIGAEERNNFCFMVYNFLVPSYGHRLAFEGVLKFNGDFLSPMTTHELEAVVVTAKKKGGYQYSTEKLKEFLHITEEEAGLIGLDASEMPHIGVRQQEKLKTATKKNRRDEEILALYQQGFTREEVAVTLELSLPTVRKVLRVHEVSHKQSREETMKQLGAEGKTYEEIALICGCSTRTVGRFLGKPKE